MAVAAGAASCSRGDDLPAVPVALPTATPRGCDDFADALPDGLGEGLRRRATRPADPRVAAYGDPPVVVRCAAPFSTRFERASPLVSVNQVDWFQEIGADAVTWSTPTAFVNVEVRIPTRYEGHGGMLALLTEAARAAQ